MREQRNNLDHPLASWGLEEQYAWSKKIGIRFLHPYFDTDLAEMLYRTPPRLLSEGGRTKALVRGTLARRFPDIGLGGQRKTAATPFYHSVIRREAPAIVDAVGDYPALAALGVVDGSAMRQYVCDVLNGRLSDGVQFVRIFHILTLETWVRSRV
jgi:hypothetical protein